LAAQTEVHDLSDEQWEEVLNETGALYLQLSEEADRLLCECHRRDFDYTETEIREKLAAKLARAFVAS